MSVTIDTTIRDLTTGRTETVTQTIELIDINGAPGLRYTVRDGEHEVLVDAHDYINALHSLLGMPEFTLK